VTAALRRFGPLALVVAAVAAALLSGVTERLSLSELEAHRQALLSFVQARPILSVGGFILAYVAMAATGLPGPLIFTIAGGLLFGTVLGSLAVLTGATAGSVLLFLACRSAFGGMIAGRVGPRLAAVEAMIRGAIFEHVLILRLLPVFPLGVVTAGAGLIGAPLGAFTAGTLLGMIPSTLIYTSLGAGFNRVLDQGGRLNADLLGDPQIILPLAGLGLLACGPLAYRVWRTRRRKDGGPDLPEIQ
jgi:uncharacterized membrane protein YdjX (TVP38/TMEM64 family)